MVSGEPGDRLGRGAVPELAGQLADRLAQLNRTTRTFALPERHLARLAGRRRHQHTRLALDLSAFAVVELPPEWWIPAPGQGALAAQCRAGDQEIETQIALLADAACVEATRWEREFLRVIEGGCSTPFGCYVDRQRARTSALPPSAAGRRSSVELPQRFIRGIAT